MFMLKPVNCPLELARKIWPKELALKQLNKVNGAVSDCSWQLAGDGHVI
jgi:hypothetical protein